MPLAGLFREYPNKIAHVLNGAGDAATPRRLTPAFFGCFDWHSAVHGHWCLARLLRLFPGESWSDEANGALAASLTPEHIAAEVAYRSNDGRTSFECPYGVAWLLTLATELRRGDETAQSQAEILTPLEAVCARHLITSIERLPRPIRTGEHNQTAFAMGLAWDWSVAEGHPSFQDRLREAATRFYGEDRQSADSAGSHRGTTSSHRFLPPRT